MRGTRVFSSRWAAWDILFQTARWTHSRKHDNQMPGLGILREFLATYLFNDALSYAEFM